MLHLAIGIISFLVTFNFYFITGENNHVACNGNNPQEKRGEFGCI